MRVLRQHLNGLTATLMVLWLILAALMIWRIASVAGGDRWGFAVAVAMIGWLGGLVTAVLGQIFLVRDRDDW